MTLSARTILRNACRSANEPLNILSFPTHERYQTNLAGTGHNFFLWQGGEGIKPWIESYAGVPRGTVLLNPDKASSQIPEHIDIDIVLSQNKFGQFQIAKQISEQCQLPLISIEHTLPMSSWPKSHVKKIKELRGDINIFISEYSRFEWGWAIDEAEVIHHGVNHDLFCPDKTLTQREDVVLSVVNDWINRDWCCGFNLWRDVTGYPDSEVPVHVIGDTPGLSKAASSTEELVSAYQKSKIFLNTSLVSPVPTALLEAMSCGCAIVSTDTCMIPEIIQHEYNGFTAKSPKELRQYVDKLLGDAPLCAEMGHRARDTIVTKFGLKSFINSWSDVFSRCLE
jgi:hypothetical protein